MKELVGTAILKYKKYVGIIFKAKVKNNVALAASEMSFFSDVPGLCNL